jgi:hypothetical protein
MSDELKPSAPSSMAESDVVERVRASVEWLGNWSGSMSLSDWNHHSNIFLQAAAEIERLRASNTAWRDIESAPKDGTQILGYGRWSHLDPDKYLPCEAIIYWSDLAQIWASTATGFRPTHWQPLPAPPEVK